MSIESIRKRAKNGTLQVEHLLKEASYPNDALAIALDALSSELQWPLDGKLENGNLYVPLARWSKVVSTYCRSGFNGLVRLSAEPESANFVIGLLEEIKTNESLDALLMAFKRNLSSPCCDIDTSYRIAGALNLMLSFKPIVVATPDQAIALRAFLYGLYACSDSEAQRAGSLLALRGVGDESSAEFSASKSLRSPWHEVPKIVSKHIRKRLRTAAILTVEKSY